jgi:hypothetical protein
MLGLLYGPGGHDITFMNPAVPGVTLHYTRFKQITEDVDDARVYGGIHFRFDQRAGGRLGRGVAPPPSPRRGWGPRWRPGLRPGRRGRRPALALGSQLATVVDVRRSAQS